jgi:hypothetical protein
MTEQELAGALFSAGLLTRQQIEAAAAERSPHKNFAQVVVEKGWVSPAQMAQLAPQAFLTLTTPAQAMPTALDTSAFSQATTTNAASSSQAPFHQPSGQPPIPEIGGFSSAYPQTVNGTTILVLGILGLVFCQIFGPFAWVMGNKAVAAIDAGRADPAERSNANVGRILGIIGTVFLVLGIIFVLLFILAVATTAPNPNTFSAPVTAPSMP